MEMANNKILKKGRKTTKKKAKITMMKMIMIELITTMKVTKLKMIKLAT